MLDRKVLFKNLAIGFLPLLVFVAADELFGLKVGLMVAVGFGLAEAGWVYFREGRLDRFILFDTALITALGGISFLLENDIFFKIKPALIESILAGLLAVTGFSTNPLLIRMTGRYMKGIEFNPEQIRHMRRMMRRMFFLVVAHVGLTLYAAFYLSTEAWGFISGGMFYILMGAMVTVEFVRTRWQRRKMLREFRDDEWFDLVTPEGKVVGRAPRRLVHGNPQLLHPVVHVHILNSRGELFLQKRADTKDLYPGYWDTAVGGHVRSGESIDRALHREAEEELGISMGNFRPLFRYVMQNRYESELVHAFLLEDDGPFYINKKEIAEGRFWNREEIER
ncbi:MAG: NUDIX domain-containing protein, partial [Calditrichaeota bacterium]